MNRKVYLLLIEARDRFLQFSHSGECLTDAWTGLGYASTYKPALDVELMEWVHGEPPFRCVGWLRLTETGAEIVADWLKGEIDEI